MCCISSPSLPFPPSPLPFFLSSLSLSPILPSLLSSPFSNPFLSYFLFSSLRLTQAASASWDQLKEQTSAGLQNALKNRKVGNQLIISCSCSKLDHATWTVAVMHSITTMLTLFLPGGSNLLSFILILLRLLHLLSLSLLLSSSLPYHTMPSPPPLAISGWCDTTLSFPGGSRPRPLFCQCQSASGRPWEALCHWKDKWSQGTSEGKWDCGVMSTWCCYKNWRVNSLVLFVCCDSYHSVYIDVSIPLGYTWAVHM